MRKIAILLTLCMMLAGCTDLAEETAESTALTNQDLDGTYFGLMMSFRVSMNADDTFDIYVLQMEDCFETNAEAQEAIDEENEQNSEMDDEYDYDYEDDMEYNYVIVEDVCVASEFALDDDDTVTYEAVLGVSGLTPTLTVSISESDDSYFECDDGDEIPDSWVNDGEEDCSGGEDEAEGAESDIVYSYEPVADIYLAADGYGMMAWDTGADGKFTCDDGEDIPADYVNDGDEDCDNGEDEAEGAEDSIEFDDASMCLHLSPTGVFGLTMDAMEILEDESDFDPEDASTVPASVTAMFASHDTNYSSSTVSTMATGCEDVSYIEGVLLTYLWANSLAEGSTDDGFVMYQFSVTDANGTPTIESNEALVYVAMDSGDDLSWSIPIVQISVDGSSYMECTKPGQTAGAGCVISDGPTTDGEWGFGEEVIISEGSDDLCNQPCDIQVKIIDARDNMVIYESNLVSVS